MILLFTSMVAAPCSLRRAHNRLVPPYVDSVDDRMARGHAHWRMARARRTLGEVVVVRSAHLDSLRHVVVGSHLQEDAHHVVGHSGPREDHRSSRHVEEECGDDSHPDVGCNHVVVGDDRSSSHPVVVHLRSRGHGSLANETGSARVDVGSRIVAVAG